jgi:hypothetical protein
MASIGGHPHEVVRPLASFNDWPHEKVDNPGAGRPIAVPSQAFHDLRSFLPTVASPHGAYAPAARRSHSAPSPRPGASAHADRRETSLHAHVVGGALALGDHGHER